MYYIINHPGLSAEPGGKFRNKRPGEMAGSSVIRKDLY
jgi:hypothetical protein